MRTPTPLRPFTIHGALAALLALSAACSSVNPYEVNRDLLASAGKSLAAEDSAAAARTAEKLYAARAAEAGEYRLQRFHALALATQAHMQAAAKKPFLDSENAGAGIGAARLGDVPHLVAATYYASLAKDLAPGAKQDKLTVEGVKLLPPDLESVGVELAQKRLDLYRIVALSRLGFASTVRNEIDAWPELATPEKVDELIGELALEKEVVPWVYYTLFHAAAGGDDRVVYTFGAKARVAAAGAKGALPNERGDELVQWVRNKAEKEKLLFCCQTCRKPFPADKLRCLDDSTPITTFFAMKSSNE